VGQTPPDHEGAWERTGGSGGHGAHATSSPCCAHHLLTTPAPARPIGIPSDVGVEVWIHASVPERGLVSWVVGERSPPAHTNPCTATPHQIDPPSLSLPQDLTVRVRARRDSVVCVLGEERCTPHEPVWARHRGSPWTSRQLANSRRWEADDVAFRDVLRLSIIPKAWQPIASDDPMDMRMGSLAAC
jgi:hypothetical protein